LDRSAGQARGFASLKRRGLALKEESISVAPDVLRQVPTFEALLVHGMLRPAHLRARPYYAEGALRRMSDRPIAEKRNG
jgi:hypothetical protein